MAFTVQNGEPSELLTGTSWEWDRHVSDALPSDGWVLTYEFRGPGAIDTIQAATSSEGDYYEVREDKDFSDRFAGGMYEVSGFVTLGTDRNLIWRGRIYVRDLTADELSTRSHTECVFAAIKDTSGGRPKPASDPAGWRAGNHEQGPAGEDRARPARDRLPQLRPARSPARGRLAPRTLPSSAAGSGYRDGALQVR
jgi:hypothetical protein